MKITYDHKENSNSKKLIISIIILILAVSVRMGITGQFTDSSAAVSVFSIVESGISGQTKMKEALDIAYKQAFMIDSEDAIYVFSSGEYFEKNKN